MLTYKSLTHNGRIGNILFEAASTIGLAKKFGHDYVLPEWDGFKYFEHDFKTGNIPFFDRNVRENGFTYDEEFWKQNLHNTSEKINIQGYLQSELYFEDAKKLFRFRPNKRLDVLFAPYKKETTIALHVRRGDYTDNPNYVNLGVKYYLNALPEIPQGKVIVFTDDYRYCRNMFRDQGFVYDFDGLSAMDHLYLMSKCDHFIVANSTFSWWGAYLGEKKGSVVVRPDKYFLGSLEDHDTSQFWPKHWIKVEAVPDRDNLSDVTIVIPISFDGKDRKQNIQVLLRYLHKNFRVKIILGEQGSGYRFKYLERYVTKYIYFDDIQDFHRTKMINEMVKMADTTIVAICDSDVLIPRGQMISAAHKIRVNGADVVYPYDGRFIRCLKEPWTSLFDSDPYRVNSLDGVQENMNLYDKESFGGIFFVDKFSYMKAGMENENFVSFGREDVERYVRFKGLGLTVTREEGCLYHLHHRRGLNSTMRHPHAKQNSHECRKVINMNYDELREYVDGWKWLKT